MTHAHSYFKARKELRAIIYCIEKRTNYISNSAEIQCSSALISAAGQLPGPL